MGFLGNLGDAFGFGKSGQRDVERGQGLIGLGQSTIDPNSYGQEGFAQDRSQYGALADRFAQRQAPGVRDMSGSDFRGGQQALIAQLQQRAAGQGPSMANIAAQQAANRSMQGQQAMAAGAAPGNAALAARTAAQQGAAAQGSVAGQAAMGRAQEILGAQAQLGQQLGQSRAQDQAFQRLGLERDLGAGGLNLRAQEGGSQAALEALRQRLQLGGQEQQGAISGQQLQNQLIAALLGQQAQPNPLLGTLGGIASAYASFNNPGK